jgi:hypothetical protein
MGGSVYEEHRNWILKYEFYLLGYNAVYSADFQRDTLLYIPVDRTAHNRRRESVKSSIEFWRFLTMVRYA